MTPLFEHQVTGVAAVTAKPALLLADEMRLGKTRTTIAAAEVLFQDGVIDAVLVVAPASCRGVWFDPEFGQIAEYSTVPVMVEEYRAAGSRRWAVYDRNPPDAKSAEPSVRYLRWTVTNYELIRRAPRLQPLLEAAGPKTLLVLDESIAVAGHFSQQTKAVFKLRQKCGRVLELNGTPWGDNPGAVYSQMKILDPKILGCATWYDFVARYGVMGGFRALRSVKRDGVWRKEMAPTQIVRWVNLDDLSRRTSTYVLRRTMDQVFDLPPALEPVVLTAQLSAESWKVYKQMRDDAVVYLRSGVVSAAQAGVKMLRLRQITAGFLGGVEDAPSSTQEIGREKLDAILEWFQAQLAAEPGFKSVIWCVFRAEAERLHAALSRMCEARLLYGQGAGDREAALRLMDPRTAGPAPGALVGIARAGGFGLNFAAASTMLYASNDSSLIVRQQSEARILGPDQSKPTVCFDLVAEGPKGQRTVDHVVLKALRSKRDVASLTAAEWIEEVAE